MSKHNYSQYSNKNNVNTVTEEELHPIETAAEAAVEQVVEPVVEPVVETPVVESPVVKTIIGTVVDCTKLNVRAQASIDAEPVCVLAAASTVEIDKAKSNKEWYRVTTATGVEGYCMKKFIKITK